MPATDPEPEKYSIDDMMDRLRSRGDGGSEGEAQLVTREDGSQVYRMRKRKRRSQQPKKQKEKLKKRFKVAQVIGAVALVILTALGFFVSLLYLNSAAYRETVLGRIRAWTGAEPKVTVLRVTPVSAGAAGFELKWPEDSMLDHLSLSGINGDLQATKLLSGKWKGNEMLSSLGGTLTLRPPSPLRVKNAATGGDCPFLFRFRSEKFAVLMGEPTRPSFRLRDSEASLVMLDATATNANLQFEGGMLNIGGWGDFTLKLASLQFEAGEMHVGTLRMTPAGGGKGEIQIDNPTDSRFDLNGGESELTMRFTQTPVEALLGPAFGTWLRATVETPEGNDTGKLRFRSGANPEVSLRVPFRAVASSDTEAMSLPMFAALAHQLQDNWYQRPRFDLEAKGELVRTNTTSGLENLVLDARGRLSMGGKVFVNADGSLGGTFQVGLPAAAVANATPELRAVFNRKGGGFSWATVNISGDGRNPQDDLEAQLTSSAASLSPAKGGVDGLEDAFKDLTTPEGE